MLDRKSKVYSNRLVLRFYLVQKIWYIAIRTFVRNCMLLMLLAAGMVAYVTEGGGCEWVRSWRLVRRAVTQGDAGTAASMRVVPVGAAAYELDDPPPLYDHLAHVVAVGLVFVFLDANRAAKRMGRTVFDYDDMSQLVVYIVVVLAAMPDIAVQLAGILLGIFALVLQPLLAMIYARYGATKRLACILEKTNTAAKNKAELSLTDDPLITKTFSRSDFVEARDLLMFKHEEEEKGVFNRAHRRLQEMHRSVELRRGSQVYITSAQVIKHEIAPQVSKGDIKQTAVAKEDKHKSLGVGASLPCVDTSKDLVQQLHKSINRVRFPLEYLRVYRPQVRYRRRRVRREGWAEDDL